MLQTGREIPSVVAFNVEVGSASVTGTVLDSFTQQPLANARAAINGKNLSAMTDSQGKFTLEGIPNRHRDPYDHPPEL